MINPFKDLLLTYSNPNYGLVPESLWKHMSAFSRDSQGGPLSIYYNNR